MIVCHETVLRETSYINVIIVLIRKYSERLLLYSRMHIIKKRLFIIAFGMHCLNQNTGDSKAIENGVVNYIYVHYIQYQTIFIRGNYFNKLL